MTTVKLDKVTEGTLSRRRVYDDACGMAHGLELLGDRWTLAIVRELLLGPRRFGDLRRDLSGISANVLTQRLGELEGNGIVERTTLPPPAGVAVYGLTEWGHEAEPIVLEIGRWALRSLGHDATLPISTVSIMLSMRAMIRPARIGTLRLTAGFRFGAEDFSARIDPDGIAVARGRPAVADLRFEGEPGALAFLLYGKHPAADLADRLHIEGDPACLDRFAALFDLPPKFDHPRAPRPRNRAATRA